MKWKIRTVLPAITLILLTGCAQFSLRDLLLSKPFELVPGSLTVQTGGSYTFTVREGVPPYEFSILSGNGSIDPVTGLYTAPGIPETGVVGVLDTEGKLSTATVKVTNAVLPLEIVPAAVTLDPGDSLEFNAFGGVGSYSWTLESGSIGTRTGTTYHAPADESGTAVMRVEDQDGDSRTANITVAAPSALIITPQDITVTRGTTVTFIGGGGYAQNPSHYTYGAAGVGSINIDTGVYNATDAGTADITVSDLSGSSVTVTVTVEDPGVSLPVGISPSEATVFTNGAIDLEAYSGVPGYTFTKISGGGSVDSATGLFSAPAAAGTSVIRVTDSVSGTADASITVIAPLTVTPTAASVSTGGAVSFTVSGGTGGYTWDIDPPGGGSIDGSGNYTAPGSGDTVTVTVTDSSGNEADALVSVTLPMPLGITPSMVTMLTGEAVTFSGFGGIGGYTFSPVTGGGSINSTSGVYTAPGSPGTATVRVSDGTDNADASITIVASGPLTISPNTAVVGTDSTLLLTAWGGKPPYSFSVESGIGSVNASTGVYTASSSPGSAEVEVTDADGDSATAMLTVEEDEFNEMEPNNGISSANDFGLVLSPGFSITISGTTDSGNEDAFRINTGTATSGLITCSFPGGGNAADIYIKRTDGNDIVKAESTAVDAETISWTIGSSGTDRIIWLEPKDNPGTAYTLTITGS